MLIAGWEPFGQPGPLVGPLVNLACGSVMLVLSIRGTALSKARAARYKRQERGRPGSLSFTLEDAQRRHLWMWRIVSVAWIGVSLVWLVDVI